MLQQGEIVDLLFGEDECLVLLQDRCLHLTAVATATLAFLDRPRAAEEVLAHVEARFGPAPEGRAGEILDDLVKEGVLHREGPVPSGDS